ncbi:MAG: WbqC family protein [Muribaculaceae bacterium]|nr:WbqC family protein [Muribaculaceae bacterium]
MEPHIKRCKSRQELILNDHNDVIMSPVLFPPVGTFVELWGERNAYIELPKYWNKRNKDTHRYEISDVNGPIKLTVPVEKPESYSRTAFDSIKLSSHGEWWHIHRVTLESAYGRTPYFEHYFPRFEKFFRKETLENYPYLWMYLLATSQTLCESLGLETTIALISEQVAETKQQVEYPILPYWQIRQDRFGFLPGLSALDLLFNMGPESILYIRQLNQDS